GVIAILYAVVTQRTRVFFEDVRDTRNVYMRLLDGLIDGFKELSMHSIKRKGYRGDVEQTCDEFRSKLSYAMIKFVNAFLVGESLLVVVLGAVAFAIPRMFPHIPDVTLMGFIMVLLYLIGPINGILNSIPGLMQLKISWNRVKEFMQDIPANIAPGERQVMDLKENTVEHFKAKGLTFAYEDANGAKGFSVGPIDLEAKKGEVIFIIGGNGSGKTTVAKLFTGLYVPDNGRVEIDGKEIPGYQLGEYYSTVYGNYHLFEKLYNVDLNDKEEEVRDYLRLLRLNEKVTVEDNKFTTINLSGGQRKRLALLQCYLENCPIFLFDEVAADQDPQFRKFFYRDLLFRMKEKGKIVIAITHDDHYFDVADRVIKLDMGKVETVDSDYQVTRPSV
ncbi:MAG: cyclic peptide export ABC transporter, partial [bacterium]|nr:cyclic peptide export ABC transporter [bacterium]